MSNYVALNELPRNLEDGQRLAWQCDPGTVLNSGHLGLHLQSTGRIIRMAGFGGVIVKSELGEQSTYKINSLTMVDAEPDGSIAGTADVTASRAKTEHASIIKTDNLASMCSWPTAIVALNRNEIASRIANNMRAGMPEHLAQATELDRSLQRAILRVAAKKLRNDFLNKNELEPLHTSVLAAGEGAVGIITSSPLAMGLCLAIFHTTATINSVAINRRATHHHHLEKKRLSIFPRGPQPDRFLLAAGMLLGGRQLLKPLTP